MIKYDHRLRFIPPPWLEGLKPREIYADRKTSLFDLLLNYSLFFWNGQEDISYIPGFFCLRTPKGFFYMDFIPGFYLARLSDFIPDDKDDSVIEIGYIVHKDAKVPQGFADVRKKIKEFMLDLDRYFTSYRRVMKKDKNLDSKDDYEMDTMKR